MIKIVGISHLPKDVQTYITEQFAEKGCVSFLVFSKRKHGVGFELYTSRPTSYHETMYLSSSKFVGQQQNGDEWLQDYRELSFSDKMPESPKTTITATEVDLEVPDVSKLKSVASNKKDTSGGGGGNWNGYPMADDIPFREAMFAVCTMDAVTLNGKKLVLRDGKWHRN